MFHIETSFGKKMEKRKILVVEDEAITAMSLEVSLENLGYQVTSIVNSGKDALNSIDSNKPDIVLMDIKIKGDMDGIDTAEIIREKFDLPFVFSTAFLDQERINRAKITMPFGYVLKPIQERELKITLEMAMHTSKIEAFRKEAEKRLIEREQQLNTIYNATSNYMCLLEYIAPNQYHYLTINDAYCHGVKMINPDVRRDDIVSLEVEEFGELMNWPPSVILGVKKHYEKAIKTKQLVKIIDTVPSVDGNLYLEGTYTPIFDDKGNCTQILYVSQDITRYVRLEHELRSELEKKDELIKKLQEKVDNPNS